MFSGEDVRRLSEGKELRRYVPILAGLGVALLVSGALFFFRASLGPTAQRLGYVGVFITSLAGAATVFLPVPSIAIVLSVLPVLQPLVVPLVAAAGEAIGELTGYLIGYGGRAVIQRRDVGLFQRLEGWMRRRGVLVLIIWSAIPNPLYDIGGIAAGGLRLPLWQFLPAVWAGKALKWYGVTFLFTHGVKWVVEIMQTLP